MFSYTYVYKKDNKENAFFTQFNPKAITAKNNDDTPFSSYFSRLDFTQAGFAKEYFTKKRFNKKSLYISIFCAYTLLFMESLFADSLDTMDNTTSKDSNTKHYQAKAATVTATRIPTTITEAPGNVSIIDKESIKMRPNSKISDTLRGIEGLRQSKSRGMDTFDGVTIRGVSSGAMIMLDGVILNDMDNNTKMITAMNADDLEQVEVIRGPFSNLYGSGALSGAINFVTAMPNKFELRANIGYGNPFVPNTAQENLVRGYLSIGDTYFENKLKLKASYGFTTTDGYAADSAWVYKGDTILNNGVTGGIPSKNPQGTDIVIIGDMGKQKYQTHDLKFKAQYDLTESITLDSGLMFNYYGYTHEDHTTFLRKNGEEYWGDNSNQCNGSCSGGNNANRPMPMYAGRGIGQERFAQNIFYIGYKQYFDDILLSARYSRIDGWRDFNNPDGGASGETNANTTLTGGPGSQTKDRFQTNNLDIFTNIPIFDIGQNLLIGFQARQLSMDESVFNLNDWTNYSSNGSNYVNTKENKGGKSLMSGVFIELRSEWNKYLSTTLGLRYDYWLGYDYYTKTNSQVTNNSKHKISPKATLNYYINDTSTLKASIGQGFRAPTLSQMFSTYKTNNGITTIGNPNLKPESATSFDIGFEQKLSFSQYSGLIKAYYFNTFMSDVIYNHLEGNTNYLKNGGLALINGLELSYKQNLPYNLSLLFTYTFTNSDMLRNPADKSIEGKKLTGIPEHLGYAQIAYDDSVFFGSFGIEMMSKPFSRADNKDTIGGVYSATDGYVLGDVRVGYRFLKHYEVAFNATNIFNQKYFSYYRAPGAAFFIQAGATF